jgi:hypothetical protein
LGIESDVIFGFIIYALLIRILHTKSRSHDGEQEHDQHMLDEESIEASNEADVGETIFRYHSRNDESHYSKIALRKFRAEQNL